jgi:hypothetical protein
MSKITMKALGNPKAAAALVVGDGKKVFVGRVMGFASGQVAKLTDDGDTVYGLKGTFKAFTGDGKKEIRSGVCYLPGGIQESVSEAIPDKDGRVQFVFDIFTQAATNKSGIEYVAAQIGAPTMEDPFSALEADLPGLPQLAAPAVASEPAKA